MFRLFCLAVLGFIMTMLGQLWTIVEDSNVVSQAGFWLIAGASGFICSVGAIFGHRGMNKLFD